MLRAILSTAVFNIKRSKRLSHLLWLAGLILFPPALGILVGREAGEFATDSRVCLFYLYVTVVRVVTPLALLLWATPVVHNELESGTWPFVAIRPRGRIGIFGGGYLSALFWAVLCGWSAMAFTVLALRPPDLWLVARVIGELVVWSALAYGAVYSLIGVLFLKRAMPIAVAYTLLVEVVINFIPAVVNQVTVDYRLRTIGFMRLENSAITLDIPAESTINLIGSAPPAAQIGILIAYAAGALFLGSTILHRRELVLAER